MPKHSVINEYKWAIRAMLHNAKFPYIGSASKLKLRATTLDDGTVSLHVNLPWLLGGRDEFDLPVRRESDRWGWEIKHFLCKGQKLIHFMSYGLRIVEEIINMADPSSNQRLAEVLKEGIEKAHLRQTEYANKRRSHESQK